MAAAGGTSGDEDTKTFVNRTPPGDARAGIWDDDHNDDRGAAGPVHPTKSGKERALERDLDVPRTGEAAASDRYSVISLMTENRTYGPDRDIGALVLAILDDIIRTPKKLHALTLLNPEEFDYTCIKFAERVAERGLDRLFWDDDARASDPGTRCKLYIRHALLMTLYRKKDAATEAALGVFFGMDQGTASRYLKVVNEVLAEILPTARNMAKAIRSAYEGRSGSGRPAAASPSPSSSPPPPPPQASSATPVPAAAAGPVPERPGPISTSGPSAPVAATDDPPAPTVIGAPTGGHGTPGTLAGPSLEAAGSGLLSTRVATITDGMHTPTERTKDADWNRATYSGKKKAHTLNTNITVSPDGTLIDISETAPGSTNDLTLLRESPPDLGDLSEAAADPETPEDERPINIYDRGYQGIQKDTPGAEVWMGMKRNAGSDPETGGLTQRERDHNTEVTRARIIVEHAIGRIKQYRVMTRPYHGTPDQFNDELNVVTGLVNLKWKWDEIKSREDPALMAKLASWRTR